MQEDAGRCKTHISSVLVILNVLFSQKIRIIFASSTGGKDVVRPDDKINSLICNFIIINLCR